ncbi:hypothetical protein ACFFX1_36340 [Dactylosporangium sucinum]|uniref:hypothetical protein n=1 Tax=Dactylosporangium sucinum TaxID=1424081 RepID=UPI00167CF388|nr:hypothetical protein [Dactylosporangium sucinum]
MPDSKAEPADPAGRLAGVLLELFLQVPRMQRRYRAALSTIHPDDAIGLIDAWTEFRQALASTRYDPETGGLLRLATGSGEPGQAAELSDRGMGIVAELADARIRLRQEIQAAEVSLPAVGQLDRATLLARLRLLHQGERHLRRAVVRAMSVLPAADHHLLRGLAPLAAGYTAYLAAERALARQWAVVAEGRDPAAAATLDHWLSYTADLLDLLDQLIAGYGEPRPMPAVPWSPVSAAGPAEPALPTPAAVEQPPAGSGLRSALHELHDGYPDLIAGCRRVLAELGGVGGLPTAGTAREGLLSAWGRCDDALASLAARVKDDQFAHPAGTDADSGLRAELDRAADLRAALADQLAEAEAWLARTEAPAAWRQARPGAEQSPSLVTAGRHGVPHRLHWLTDQPRVNAEAFELYVASRWPAGRSIVEGVPGPWLFLTGRLDGADLAGETRDGSVLRVRVGAGTAIDGSSTGHRGPAELHYLLAAPGTYLLPVAWLSDTRIVDAYRVDAQGRLRPESLLDGSAGQPLTSYPIDARHGVAGLPNEVVYWPSRRMFGAATVYALIPDPSPHRVPDWLVVHEQRPQARPGHHLVELHIGWGWAIDITATVARLGALPRLRSIADDLHASGVRLVLPRRSYASVRIKRVWRPGRGWRPTGRPGSLSLASLLWDEVGDSDQPIRHTG